LEDNVLKKSSPYHDQIRNGNLGHLIVQQYATEISAIQERPLIQLSELGDLDTCLIARLKEQAQGMSKDHLERIKFSIRLSDTVGPLCLNVSFTGSTARVERAVNPAPDTLFVLETHSELFRNLFTHPWAGDLLVIGYGGEIWVNDAAGIKEGLLRTAVDLLSAYPSPVSYMRDHPFRIARYISQNLGMVLERIRLKVGLNRAYKSGLGSNSLVKGQHWLTEPAEELRRLCGLPGLSDNLMSCPPTSGVPLYEIHRERKQYEAPDAG